MKQLLGLALCCIWLGMPSIATAQPDRPLVGHIMALLAIFEEAEALPPENSAEANQLIHALIQTQAAMLKSTDGATRTWFKEALESPEERTHPTSQALTSRTLAAILKHAAVQPPARDHAVLSGLEDFHVGQSDMDLMSRIYTAAWRYFRSKGKDLHEAYDRVRRTMPFE